MRRGLMAWDADEIPIGVLKGRVERLQAAMAQAGQDAFILYTNFVRSGAVSYLTAFSPYWADGILLVPQRGEPLFATTLSKRVGSWIQSVKPVGEVLNTPAPGKAVGERLAGAGVRRLAVVELDDFPSGLYDDLAAALLAAEIVDGTETFAAVRGTLDEVERRLLRRAEAIAKNALEHLKSDAAVNVGEAVGSVEKHARLSGAEEVYVAIAPDLDADRRFIRLSGDRPLGRRFAVRATVAYKGAWVRRTKTYARDAKDRSAVARADARFGTLLAAIDASRPLHDQIAASIASLPDAQLAGWMAEATVGTRPLEAVASSAIPRHALPRVPALIVTAALNIGGVPWCGAGLSLPDDVEERSA